jgi:hypothetical protein
MFDFFAICIEEYLPYRLQDAHFVDLVASKILDNDSEVYKHNLRPNYGSTHDLEYLNKRTEQ